MENSLKSDLQKAIILLVIIIIAALIINWLRTPVLFAMAERGIISRAKAGLLQGVPLIYNWEAERFPVPTEPDGPELAEIKEIDVDTAKQYYDEGGYLFLDAREPDLYEEGHIAGAVNWSFDEFDLYHERYRDRITTDMPVVCYCISETCDESYILAQSLIYEYYQEVYIFSEGLDEWEFRGYPVSVGVDP
jgi:rhodanese-related sulfurtransferase